MKKKLLNLQALRTAAIGTQTALMDIARTEGEAQDIRAFTAIEQKKFDEADEEITKLDSEIENLERMIKAETRAAEVRVATDRAAKDTPEQKVAKRYSLIKAIRATVGKGELEGVEKEMHQEALVEAKRSNTQVVGNVGVPAMLFKPKTRATLETGVPLTAGNLIDTEVRDQIVGALRPELQVVNLGADIRTGLTSNDSFIRQKEVSAASWRAEKAAATETNPEFELVDLSPKGLSAFTPITLEMIMQDNRGIEASVRSDLEIAIATKLDADLINGDGSGKPEGILNTSGINNVTFGGVPTYEKLVELETLIASANASGNMMAYLTSPSVKGLLKSTKIDAGSGRIVWNTYPNPGNMGSMDMVNGYRAVTSTQMPVATGKHSMIFGDWSKLIVDQWGGVSFYVDDATQIKNGIINIVVHSWWDAAVKHAKSFSAAVDIDLA